MLCVSICPHSFEELNAQLRAAIAVGDMVEVRVDALPIPEWEELEKVVNQGSAPLMLTLRSAEQGGQWAGGQRDRTVLLRQLARLKPTYLDLEMERDGAFVADMRKDFSSTKTVISYHSFDCGPHNLAAILARMKQIGGDVYKIAVNTPSTTEALGVLSFSKRSGSEVLVIGMGENGQVTRILSPLADQPWTYASLDEQTITGPGQLTAKELLEVYHYRKLSQKTIPCGLLGQPVSQSIGQLVHNAVYEQLGIDAVYVKMALDTQELSPCLMMLQWLGFRGLSVTIPHKEAVMPLLGRIDEGAVAIGAVNTITFDEKAATGSNTDAAGALDALEEQGVVKGKNVLIIGAGGAARAIAYEAKQRGAAVTVASRTFSRSQKLAEDLGVEAVQIDAIPEAYDVLVNSTPDEMPIAQEFLREGVTVMDIKTRPKETKLLQAAAKKGCAVVYGEEMFLRQAAGQIRQWFGDQAEGKDVNL